MLSRPRLRLTLPTPPGFCLMPVHQATTATTTTTTTTTTTATTSTTAPPLPRALKSAASAFFLPPLSFTARSSSPLQRHPITSPARPSCPPPPTPPLAWTWRCHKCGTTYRVGATRRCLLDGHYFCASPPPPLPERESPEEESLVAMPPPLPLAERGAYHRRACSSSGGGGVEGECEVQSTTGTGDEEETMKKNKKKQQQQQEIEANKSRSRRPKKKSTQRQHRICASSFDYLAWAEWNAWRRNLCPPGVVSTAVAATSTAAVAAAPKARRGDVDEKCRKNCLLDCDFPSECSWQRTSAYQEALWEGRSPVAPF